MPPDNVTPFRRPPPRPVRPQQSGGWGFQTHRGKAVLVQLLTLVTFLCAFFFPFPPQDGTPLVLILASCVSLALAFTTVALAMPNRYDGMPWAATHHEHAIRTLILGFVVWTLGLSLTYIHGSLFVVSFYVKLVVMVWAVLRSGVGMVLAIMRKPVWNPKGWFL
jgi:uncharacterized membrane protein